MSSSKITINDVARRAGVSIATVSRFLNNPFSIKETNRKKVEEAVKTLNYKPLLYARKLAGGKSNIYGLVIPGYEGIFYSFYALEIIRGVGVSIEKLNVDLYIHIFWNKDKFPTSLVEGVIFADIIDNKAQLRRVLKEKVPCVVINNRVNELEVSYIAIDNFKGAYQATEFLINHRHRDIAHITGDLKVQCAQERLQGYKMALIKNNIKVKDKYIKVSNFSRAQARRCVEELFSLSCPPTAIFAGSDEIAWEVLNFARANNLDVPRQLSIIGYDDNPLCISGEVALTTVRQPLREMASLGVAVLKKIIEKKEKIKKMILAPELVIRDSVGFK